MKLVCEMCGSVAEAVVRDVSGRIEIACSACGAAQQIGGPPVPSKEEQPAEPSPVPPDSPGGDDAWSEVVAHWGDDGAHRAYLDRLTDLLALGDAGQHYREVLDARPLDETARRWRDEIVKRATALALPQLSGPRPSQPQPRLVRLLISLGIAMGIACLLGIVVAVVVKFLQILREPLVP